MMHAFRAKFYRGNVVFNEP